MWLIWGHFRRCKSLKKIYSEWSKVAKPFWQLLQNWENTQNQKKNLYYTGNRNNKKHVDITEIVSWITHFVICRLQSSFPTEYWCKWGRISRSFIPDPGQEEKGSFICFYESFKKFWALCGQLQISYMNTNMVQNFKCLQISILKPILWHLPTSITLYLQHYLINLVEMIRMLMSCLEYKWPELMEMNSQAVKAVSEGVQTSHDKVEGFSHNVHTLTHLFRDNVKHRITPDALSWA